mgnify:CR=1 FL=1
MLPRERNAETADRNSDFQSDALYKTFTKRFEWYYNIPVPDTKRYRSYAGSGQMNYSLVSGSLIRISPKPKNDCKNSMVLKQGTLSAQLIGTLTHRTEKN